MWGIYSPGWKAYGIIVEILIAMRRDDKGRYI
jgi:hypothetical protein